MAGYNQSTKLMGIFDGVNKIKNVYQGTAKLWASFTNRVLVTGTYQTDLYTLDGITFNSMANVNSVSTVTLAASDGETILLITNNNTIMKSSDNGATWVEVTKPGGSILYYGVVYGNGIWIIYTENVLYYSTDLTKWQSKTMTFEQYERFNSIIYTGGYFLFLTDFTLNSQLTGFKTYKVTSVPFSESDVAIKKFTNAGNLYNDRKNACKYYIDKKMFLAAGYDGFIRSLDDGNTWSRFPYSNSNWLSRCYITYGNGKYCAVMYYETATRVFYSTDLINWTIVDSIYYTSMSRKGIEFINGRFMVIVDNTRIATSTDCINWTTVTVPYYGNDEFSLTAITNAY
ncbi:WD40/YVTN/BNR-like repeat-containing protein [Lachnoclostridium phytofermentans]|uniref:WD40/YVTN/BNR-like repeat-containing protein n=1 Tax=Lachnoclostridium phytofermentans TaxID=66219 RepID=UPI000497496F|nr:hypothetical protein [Lachnoclostridium phytofermentans]